MDKPDKKVMWLRIEFSPAWGFIDDVRRFVEAFSYNCELDGDRAGHVGLAVHELLQNAVHYSQDGWASVDVDVDKPRKTVSIRTQSRSSPQQIARLKSLIDRMEKEPDPLKHYVTLMKETAGRTEGSGLGLARVRFEGRMEVTVTLRDENVTVRAWGPIISPPLMGEGLAAPKGSTP